MDYTRDLHELCDILSRELSEATSKIKNGMTAGDLEYIDKLTHALKSAKTTLAMVESGYSYDGRVYPHYSGRRNGRYSRDNDMIAELRELMNNARDDRTRHEFQMFIDKIENM